MAVRAIAGTSKSMRRESLAAGVPFWNFFNCMPFGPHSDPTEDQIRWQIYTSIAYGAKGVLYFCYWTPRGRRVSQGRGDSHTRRQTHPPLRGSQTHQCRDQEAGT
jgi:hypothetical protein